MSLRRHAVPSAVLTLALALAAAAPALAGREAGIRFAVGVPQGDFADNAEDPGLGIAGHFALGVSPTVAIGVGADFLIYGSTSRAASLPLVEDFEVVTDNNLAGLYLMARWDLAAGSVVPYVEGRFGGQYLWTETKIEDSDWWQTSEVANTVNLDDFAVQMGGGAGLRVAVAEGGHGDPSVHLDFKALFMRGGEAEYLTEEGLAEDGGTPLLIASRSRTDLLRLEIGAVLGF